jgi:hypothetical protein
LVTFACYRAGWSLAGGLLPPGNVYTTATGTSLVQWLLGTVVAATLAVLVAASALTNCTGQLRGWYELHHGRKVLD